MSKKINYLLVVLLTAGLVLGGCGTERTTLAEMTGDTERLEETAGSTDADGAQTADGTETDEAQTADGAGIDETQTADSVETEPESQEPEIKLIMVGDVLMHMRVTNSGKREDGTYNYDHLFAPVKDLIEEADLALVNQEVILGGTELELSGYPRFNAPYEVGDALVEAGFDVVLHATNHTVDKGKTGVLNCLNYWEENHPEIGVVGIQDSQEEREQIYVYEQDGIRIAILNYTYGTNGLPVPKDMPYLVNLMDEEQIRADVERAKEVSDFVVLCPHWGTEYQHRASKAQKQWAKFFLECGVDLVIGTHPHVIQPVEWVENEEGDRMLVYYSLGNFVNSTASEGKGVADRMLGAMATVTIARNEAGEVYIKEYGAEPLMTYVSGNGKNIATYRMDDFTEEMAESSSTHRKDPDFTVEYCRTVWEEVFGHQDGR